MESMAPICNLHIPHGRNNETVEKIETEEGNRQDTKAAKDRKEIRRQGPLSERSGE